LKYKRWDFKYTPWQWTPKLTFYLNWWNFVKKVKKIYSNSKFNWFWIFSIIESEKIKGSKNQQMSILVCSQTIEGWFKICISFYLIYSHIWLNLLRGNHHFSYRFLWMIAALATNKKTLKKKPVPKTQNVETLFTFTSIPTTNKSYQKLV